VNIGISPGILVRLVVFLLGSYGIIRLSMPSLRDPQSRRFHRALAFEILLVLFLINIPAWLYNPFSPLQLASWILLIGSALLAIHGFTVLGRRGRPSGPVESTTVLVTSGMYRYIRHPLYASLLYLGWGICLKRVTALTAALALAVTLFLFLTAKIEERENVDKFGSDYLE
jgi:protein-S-isoprenylcysteine O-methyltransferase Ste14